MCSHLVSQTYLIPKTYAVTVQNNPLWRPACLLLWVVPYFISVVAHKVTNFVHKSSIAPFKDKFKCKPEIVAYSAIFSHPCKETGITERLSNLPLWFCIWWIKLSMPIGSGSIKRYANWLFLRYNQKSTATMMYATLWLPILVTLSNHYPCRGFRSIKHLIASSAGLFQDFQRKFASLQDGFYSFQAESFPCYHWAMTRKRLSWKSSNTFIIIIQFILPKILIYHHGKFRQTN